MNTYRKRVSRWGASDLDPVDREGRKGLAWDGLSGVGPCPPILGTGVPRSPKNSLAQEDPVTNANSYTLSNIFCFFLNSLFRVIVRTNPD